VVAGSFHFGDSTDELFNISTLLNHQGDVLLQHRKMKRFQITEEDINADPKIQKTLKISSRGGHEYIGESASLTCIDTPLGRIAICICIDYFHEDFQFAFQNSRANVFFVPAMSDTVTQFQTIAPLLGNTNLASTFVANARCFARSNAGEIDEKAASFYYLPDREAGRTSAGSNSSELLVFDLGVK
jgi:predicted amidohydrolase